MQQDSKEQTQTVGSVLQHIKNSMTSCSESLPNLPHRYGTAEQLIARFCPDKQYTWCRLHRQRMFTGDAPSLTKVAEQYGDGTAMSWLSKQLQNLSEFSGAHDKLTPQQILQLSSLILEEYGHYKLTELMVFFHDYKAGRFGTFYGSVDPLTIMKSLREFWRVQCEELTKYYAEEKERERQEYEQEVQRKSEELMQGLIERAEYMDFEALGKIQRLDERCRPYVTKR